MPVVRPWRNAQYPSPEPSAGSPGGRAGFHASGGSIFGKMKEIIPADRASWQVAGAGDRLPGRVCYALAPRPLPGPVPRCFFSFEGWVLRRPL